MSDKNQDKHSQSGKAGKPADSEASLQEELNRETAEGAGSVGDVGSNRTVSGSSTWETLPDKNEASAAESAKGKTPQKPQGSGRTPRKRR